MKLIRTTVLAAILTTSLASQPTPKGKPQHLRISKYMRDVGLIYLEEVQNLEDRCEDPLSEGSFAEKCRAAIDDWRKRVDSIERRIDLALRESRRAAGDVRFFSLLKITRAEEDIYMTGTVILNHPDDGHLAGYINCKEHAMEDMKSGFTNARLSNVYLDTDDECEGGMKKAK